LEKGKREEGRGMKNRHAVICPVELLSVAEDYWGYPTEDPLDKICAIANYIKGGKKMKLKIFDKELTRRLNPFDCGKGMMVFAVLPKRCDSCGVMVWLERYHHDCWMSSPLSDITENLCRDCHEKRKKKEN